MRGIALLILSCLAIALAGRVQAFDPNDPSINQRCPGNAEWDKQVEAYHQTLPTVAPSDPALSARLVKLGFDDQKARQFNWSADDKKAIAHVNAVDKRNMSAVRQIIAKYGVPSLHLVGSAGMNALFFIVQHSDDYAFQAKMLKVFQSRQDSGIPLDEIAILEDRVLVHQGKPQIYGSQFTMEDGKLIQDQVEDLDHVDERRKTMFLAPIEVYKCVLAVVAGM
jgi:hypothetical protein